MQQYAATAQKHLYKKDASSTMCLQQYEQQLQKHHSPHMEIITTTTPAIMYLRGVVQQQTARQLFHSQTKPTNINMLRCTRKA